MYCWYSTKESQKILLVKQVFWRDKKNRIFYEIMGGKGIHTPEKASNQNKCTCTSPAARYHKPERRDDKKKKGYVFNAVGERARKPSAKKKCQPV